MSAKDRVAVFPAIRRIGVFVRPQLRLLLGACLLLVVGLALDLVAPLLLKQLIDQTLNSGDLSALNGIIGLFVLLYAVKFSADLVGSGLRNRFDHSILLDVRRRLYEHLQSLSLPFFQSHRTGYLTSRIFSDTNQLGGLLGGMFLGVLSNILLVAGAVAITLYLNWRLTVVLLLVVPLLALLTRQFNQRIQVATNTMQERISQMNAGVQENLSGISLIQAYTLERFASRRAGKDMDALRRANVRLADLNLLHRTGTVLMTSMAGLSVLWFGSREVVSGDLTMGELMAFLAYAVNVYRPVQDLLRSNLSMHRAAVAAKRIFELFDTSAEIVEADDAREIVTPVRGNVHYHKVCFAYDSQDVLSDVSFSVQSGMKVAVVGRSGAGKTTLLNLLPRFLDPREGRLEIDGQDLRDLKLSSLRQSVGIVSQATFLFSGTIRDNLVCIRPGASDEELTAALEAAQLGDLLSRLPSGLDTELGESGIRISGGERQRLSIARALLKDPPILIFDEATSSVDSISENRIREAINRLMGKDRTCFIIAHRFSTILDADLILVLDRGKLVGQGTHAQLYGSNPFYARLYDEQYQAADRLAAAPPQETPAQYIVRAKSGGERQVVVRKGDDGQHRVEVIPIGLK